MLLLSVEGNACRYKVLGFLKKKFANPCDAASHYSFTATKSIQTDLAALVDKAVQTDISIPDTSISNSADGCTQLQCLSSDYAKLCQEHFGLGVPYDFLVYSGSAMVHLSNNSRSNVLYSLAKGLGTLQKDKNDTLFPMKRMPMGLLEYTANFFVADDMNQVCFYISV